MTIETLARQLRDRTITSVQATDECLSRIETGNARLNAFILVMADDARPIGSWPRARIADRSTASRSRSKT